MLPHTARSFQKLRNAQRWDFRSRVPMVEHLYNAAGSQGRFCWYTRNPGRYSIYFWPRELSVELCQVKFSNKVRTHIDHTMNRWTISCKNQCFTKKNSATKGLFMNHTSMSLLRMLKKIALAILKSLERGKKASTNLPSFYCHVFSLLILKKRDNSILF